MIPYTSIIRRYRFKFLICEIFWFMIQISHQIITEILTATRWVECYLENVCMLHVKLRGLIECSVKKSTNLDCHLNLSRSVDMSRQLTAVYPFTGYQFQTFKPFLPVSLTHFLSKPCPFRVQTQIIR